MLLSNKTEWLEALAAIRAERGAFVRPARWDDPGWSDDRQCLMWQLPARYDRMMAHLRKVAEPDTMAAEETT